MTKALHRLNNIYLDVRMIMDHIDRNPSRADLPCLKTQLKSALSSLPKCASRIDDLTTTSKLYVFANAVLEKLKLEIQIEKENM